MLLQSLKGLCLMEREVDSFLWTGSYLISPLVTSEGAIFGITDVAYATMTFPVALELPVKDAGVSVEYLSEICVMTAFLELL